MLETISHGCSWWWLRVVLWTGFHVHRIRYCFVNKNQPKTPQLCMPYWKQQLRERKIAILYWNLMKNPLLFPSYTKDCWIFLNNFRCYLSGCDIKWWTFLFRFSDVTFPCEEIFDFYIWFIIFPQEISDSSHLKWYLPCDESIHFFTSAPHALPGQCLPALCQVPTVPPARWAPALRRGVGSWRCSSWTATLATWQVPQPAPGNRVNHSGDLWIHRKTHGKSPFFWGRKPRLETISREFWWMFSSVVFFSQLY